VNKLSFKSHAKLNLYLQVLNKRPDSYHNINTLFERISLCDKIILKLRRDDKEIKVISSSPDLPADPSRNLAFRSAKLLQDTFNINKGVDIKITKRIPVGSGLGGGSSNAACLLLGLNKLWKLKLKEPKLVNLAKKIGADVPFFIYNSRFAQGKGRGEKIKPLKALNNTGLWHVLVVPKIKVSTPLIYKKWDEDPGLTMPKFDVKLLPSALRKKDFSLINEFLFNSLESITVKHYPQVQNIKEKLKKIGLKTILMSGSGPAVFGVVSSRKEAVTLGRKFKREFKLLQVFVTSTI